MVNRKQTVWSSLARAVRRPTRFDDDIAVGNIGGIPLIRGNDDFRSEEMTGWEFGYRAQPVPAVSIDTTAFVQRYDQLRSQEAPVVGQIPLSTGNTLNGRSRGIELAVAVQPASAIRLTGSYSYLDLDITRDADSRDVSKGIAEANDPRHLLSLRIAVDLPRAIEADAWLRHVSALPNPAVPTYTELNARVGWRPGAAIELALIGQDLLHRSHPEFGSTTPARVEFERSVRVAVTVRRP